MMVRNKQSENLRDGIVVKVWDRWQPTRKLQGDETDANKDVDHNECKVHRVDVI